MAQQEVGRWPCEKCGRTIVVTGPRRASFAGVGAYTGPCPWDCGAWINRGWVMPGRVRAYRLDERDPAYALLTPRPSRLATGPGPA